MTGCFRGRGDTANSMAGCVWANLERLVLMKALRHKLLVRYCGTVRVLPATSKEADECIGFGAYFMPLELPEWSQ